MPERRELTRQPTRTRALLLADEQLPDVPAWVIKIANATKCLQSLPVQLILVAVEIVIWVYASYAASKAAFAAGYVDSLPCAGRATLFFSLVALMACVDFLVMVRAIGHIDMPNPWMFSKQGAAAMYKSLSEMVISVPVYLLIFWLPLCLWLRDGFDEFVVAAPLCFVALVIHNLCNACTFSFWGKHLELTQAKFAKRLVTGEFSYEQAVAEYATVNLERKASAQFLSSSSISIGILFVSMAVLLYDFEIRPWGGWYFGVLYISQALSIILIFNPWLGLHEWPEVLS